MENETKNNEELKEKDQDEQAQGQEHETAEQPGAGKPPEVAKDENELALQKALVELAEKKVEAIRQAEERRRIEKENERMKAELNHIKAMEIYKKAIEDDRIIERIIKAVSSQDHAAVADILTRERENALKRERADRWAEVPINFGCGDYQAHTQVEFDAMSMVEKSRLYRENKAEYERLSGKRR